MERDNFKNTKTKLLTKEQKKSYENAIYIYIYIYIYICHYTGDIEVLDIAYAI